MVENLHYLNPFLKKPPLDQSPPPPGVPEGEEKAPDSPISHQMVSRPSISSILPSSPLPKPNLVKEVDPFDFDSDKKSSSRRIPLLPSVSPSSAPFAHTTLDTFDDGGNSFHSGDMDTYSEYSSGGESPPQVNLGIFEEAVREQQPSTFPGVMGGNSALQKAPEPHVTNKIYDLRIPNSTSQTPQVDSPSEDDSKSNNNLATQESIVYSKIQRDFDISNLSLKNIQPGLADFIAKLYRLGLTEDQINAVVTAARVDADLKVSLDRLLGFANLALQVMGRGEDREELQQTMAYGRGVADAKKRLESVPHDPQLFERLKEIAASLAIIETPFSFLDTSGKGKGVTPLLMGKMSALSLWYYQPLKTSNKQRKKTDRNAFQFVQAMLGEEGKGAPYQGVREGEYLVYAYTVQNGADRSLADKVYVLTPMLSDFSVRYPTLPDETNYRMVQGVVDGFVVEDHTRKGRKAVVHHMSYTPFILTRALLPNKNTNGIKIQLDGGVIVSPTAKPIYYLEPITTLADPGVRLYSTYDPKFSEKLGKVMELRQAIAARSSSVLAGDPFNTAGGGRSKAKVGWY